MNNQTSTQSVKDIILVLLCGVLLCYMAFVNYFPIVYPDCGTYIISGFTFKVPVDRPIFYGIFVREASLLISLWLVIWMQGVLLALVVFYYFKYLSGTTKFRLYYILYIFIITFFTAASFNVSQLIPAVFTPISILSMGLILFASEMKKRDRDITALILVLSIAVHNSHLYISILVLIMLTFLFIFRKFREEMKVFSLKFKRIVNTWILLIITYFMICTVNVTLGAGFAFSRGGHVFLMARLIDMGIIDQYLNENCDKHHYNICEYKDKIPWDFIWDWENSPLYKFGYGWTSPQVKDEYNAIFRDVMTTPKYAHLFIVKSIESTVKQFFCFSAGDAQCQEKGSPSYYAVSTYYPSSTKEFLSSRQHGKTLDDVLSNNLQAYIFCISLFFCMFLFLYPRLAGKYKWIILFILSGLLANAFICGTFSLVLARYQTRVIWLLPLPLLLIMANREVGVSTVRRFFNNTYV